MSDIKIHIKNLEAKNYDLVKAAISYLSDVKDEFCVKQLIECLNHNSWIVRKRASDCLIAQGVRTAPFIVQRLKNTQNENIHYWGINILKNFGRPYEKEISKILENTENSNIQMFCINALSNFNDENSINLIISNLSNDNWYLRSVAAKALENIGIDSVVYLQNAFRNYINIGGNSPVCYFSLSIIAKIQGEDSFSFLETIYKNKNYLIRSYAVNSLSSINSERSMKLIINALNDRSWIVRKEAEESILRIGKNIIPILKKVIKVCNTDMKYKIIQLFGKLSDESALNSLENILNSDNYDMKYYVLVALAEKGNKRSLRLLIEEFKNELWILKKHSSDLIVEKIGVRAINSLLSTVKLYKNDPKYYEIQYWCIKTLSKLGKDAFSKIIKLIDEDIDIKVKTLIFEIIENNIGSEEFDINIIFKNLFSKEWIIRHQCVKILARTGPKIISELIKILEENDNEELIYLIKEIIILMEDDVIDDLIGLYNNSNDIKKKIIVDILEKSGSSIIKSPLKIFKNIKTTEQEIHNILLKLIEKIDIKDEVYKLIEELKNINDTESLIENIDIMDIILEETTIKDNDIILQLWNLSLKDLVLNMNNEKLQLLILDKLKKSRLNKDKFDIFIELLKAIDNKMVCTEILSIVKNIIKKDIVDFIIENFFSTKDIDVTNIIKKLSEDELLKIIYYLKEKNWQKRNEISELIYTYSSIMFIPLIIVFTETKEWFLKENIMKILTKIYNTRKYLFIENKEHPKKEIKDAINEILTRSSEKSN